MRRVRWPVFALGLGVAHPALAAPPQPGEDADADAEESIPPKAETSETRSDSVPPTVETGQIGIPQPALDEFMQGRSGQTALCAARARSSDPDVAGSVTLTLEVEANGAVSDARVATTDIADQTLADCLVATAKTWTLPAPLGGAAEVTHRFDFARASGPAAHGWQEEGKSVSETARYPRPPILPPRSAAAESTRMPPGIGTAIWGWTLFAGGWLGAAAFGLLNGQAVAAVPLVGPFVAAPRTDSPTLFVMTGIAELGGAALIVLGHWSFSRYKKRASLATRHQLHFGFSPVRRGHSARGHHARGHHARGGGLSFGGRF